MNKNILKDRRLYLVLDRQVQDYDQEFEILKASVRGGVDIVQLRNKIGTSREIFSFIRRVSGYLKGRVPLIVNDRLDLALAAGADGVHLGQDDLPLEDIPASMRRRLLVGVSCQNLAQALKAQRLGADYIGFGSVYATMTKPDRKPMDLELLARVNRRIKIPVFAIGGISLENLPLLCGLGVKRVAVTRAISLADDPQRVADQFQRCLQTSPGRNFSR